MNDKEWADAVVPDLMKMAPRGSIKPESLKRLLRRNMHLGRRGSFDAAAKSISAAACA